MKNSVQIYSAILGLGGSMPFQMVNPLLAIYLHDYLEVPLYEVGIIISAIGLSSFATKLVGGIMIPSQRVGTVMMVGQLIFVSMPLAYSLAPSAQSMYFFRVVHGVGTGMFWLSSASLVSMMSSREGRDKAFTNFATATGVGLVGGPILGTLLVSLVGVRETLALTTICFLPTILVSKRLLSMGNWSKFPNERRLKLKDFAGVLRQPVVSRVSFAYLCSSFIYGALISYGVLYGKKAFTLSEENITGLFAAYFVDSLLARIVLAKFLERVKAINFTRIGIANSALSLLGLALSPSLPLFLIFFLLLGFSHGIMWPSSSLVISNSVKPKDLVAANSVFLSNFDIGFFAGSIVPSLFISTFGITTTLALSSLAPAVAFLALVRGFSLKSLSHGFEEGNKDRKRE